MDSECDIFYNFAQNVSIVTMVNENNSSAKTFLLCIFIAVTSASCHKATLEDQAAKMAGDYTERYCPTPVKDMQRTDSITFDRETRTFNFYYTLTGRADSAENVNAAKNRITTALLNELKENMSYKTYKEAGYNFRYVFRSMRTHKVLYEHEFSKKNYN